MTVDSAAQTETAPSGDGRRRRGSSQESSDLDQVRETARLDYIDGLATITLTRPQQGNALRAQAGPDLRALALTCRSHPDLRAVVL
jgi:hypothetical protein